MSPEILIEKRQHSWNEYLRASTNIKTEQLHIIQKDLETTLFVLSQFEVSESILYKFFKNQHDNIVALIKLRSDLAKRGKLQGKCNVRAR